MVTSAILPVAKYESTSPSNGWLPSKPPCMEGEVVATIYGYGNDQCFCTRACSSSDDCSPGECALNAGAVRYCRLQCDDLSDCGEGNYCYHPESSGDVQHATQIRATIQVFAQMHL